MTTASLDRIIYFLGGVCTAIIVFIIIACSNLTYRFVLTNENQTMLQLHQEEDKASGIVIKNKDLMAGAPAFDQQQAPKHKKQQLKLP